MAKEEFDLEAVKGMKFNQFKKENLKNAVVKKSNFAVIFSKLDLVGAKKSFIPYFFKKRADAKDAFEKIKGNKGHLVKRMAFVSVTHGAGDDGAEMTLDIIKGGLAADTIISEGQELFTNTLKMGLKVVGASESNSETAETSSDEKTDDKDTKKEERQAKRAEKKAKRAEKREQMKAGIDKMDGVKDKAPKEKLNANIEKYEAALATLVAEAEADGEIDQEEETAIAELTNALNDLKEAVAQGGDTPKKKLSKENREQMNANMKKMSDRIAAIAKKLNI